MYCGRVGYISNSSISLHVSSPSTMTESTSFVKASRSTVILVSGNETLFNAFICLAMPFINFVTVTAVMCDLLKDNYVHRNDGTRDTQLLWRGSIPLVADRANVYRVGTDFYNVSQRMKAVRLRLLAHKDSTKKWR